ncbi:MAG: hypothetical protein KJ556_20230 [Gammaproteobacteria bacterium]|nr:hypothetical protein [Gammaproteobacteria bacterium]
MKTEFIEAESREQAEDLAPWAAVILEADAGWWAFESSSDAETWENQK